MESNNIANTKLSIAKYAAIKTAIANCEELLLSNLVEGLSMKELEKNYLIDLAKINNNLSIIKLLKDIPVI